MNSTLPPPPDDEAHARIAAAIAARFEELDREPISIRDPERTCHLYGGWRAAIHINPDGTEDMWLLSPAGDDLEPGCADQQSAPHEQQGPLPAEYCERLGHRCGRLTNKGRICRQPVDRPGDTCRWHVEPQVLREVS